MYALKVECIGDDFHDRMRGYYDCAVMLGPGMGEALVGKIPPGWWCAEIIGRSGRYRWERSFLRGQKDYSEANSVGSRGAYIYYHLEEGKVYEVKAPRTWRKTDRYFVRIEGGEPIEMTDAEVETWMPKRVADRNRAG